MTKDTIIRQLREMRGRLSREYGIEKLALFGSVARGEEKEASDIDLLILESREKDYFRRVAAKYFLEKVLKKPVDLGYFDSIRPVIRKRIEREMILV